MLQLSLLKFNIFVNELKLKKMMGGNFSIVSSHKLDRIPNSCCCRMSSTEYYKSQGPDQMSGMWLQDHV